MNGAVADDAIRRCAGGVLASLSNDAWVQSQRVTVLMATYNRGHYIEEALDSLLQQSRAPDEVIVVDDGSTDDTRARVRGYGERVRYLAQANGGKSAAINRGLKEATGDWIWVFDDDDTALPDGLEKLLYGLAMQRDADFVYGGQFTDSSSDDTQIVQGQVVLPPDVPQGTLFIRGLRNIPFLLPAALVRRDRIKVLGGFDERYARSQDYEFLLRLVASARGVRVPQPVFVWRSHNGARGPARERHAAALRERVWMEAGGRLGRDLRRRLPLSSYLPQ
ncbi:MAG: glycosyltransferase family 2 protein, partial [Burkholderiaceae bacterium]